MNAIQQHIDYLFQDLPETAEIKRIKNDLFLNASDRYEELISAGKTESEALGTVIIEMGDRDELLDGFSYDKETDLKEHSFNTLGEAKYFITSYKQESSKIGLGIFMILIGAGLIPALATFNMAILGVIILLVLVAAAVGLFIYSGLKIESIENTLYNVGNIFYLTPDDYAIVEDQYTIFKEKERFRIPLGVMLCIVSAIPLLYFAFLENDFLIERYGVLLLMILVGTGVYQFVKYGMNVSAYEKVLNIGEYSVDERQFQQRIEPISGLYWLVITLIYLAWSFITMSWYISWIIWPIAGVTWAIVVMILKMLEDRR